MKWLTNNIRAKHAKPHKDDGKPQAKNNLLQSYFISLLGLLLCVTMFLSTTYAWFSGGVTNTVNEIHIGVLDVALYKQEGSNYLDLSIGDTKLFDSDIRWEPGYTALETIVIRNRGSLAFRYTLGFTDGVLAEGSPLMPAEVAQYFDVWVYPHVNQEGPTATDYAAIVAPDSGWTHAGTLDVLLDGGSVLGGDMDTPDESMSYTIALHMNEGAAATVMGQRIQLSVRLIAYQLGAEQDGFQNGDYDTTTVVTNVTELLAAVENAAAGDVIVLAAGTYDFTATPLVIDKAITLQGVDAVNQPILQFVTADSATVADGIEMLTDGIVIENIRVIVDPAELNVTNE